jgi:hypothetical protein
MGTKPVEIVIREDLKAEDFNDDVLGRTRDKLYRAGPREYSCGLPPVLMANTRGDTFITTPPQ